MIQNMLTYEEMLRMPRPASARMHMDRRNRAKQFAPFDALRGFGSSIRERAVVYFPRPALCEDRKEEIGRELARLVQGDRVTVVYFQEFVPVKKEEYRGTRVECRETKEECRETKEECRGTKEKCEKTAAESREELFPPRKLQTDRDLSGMGQFETVTGTLYFMDLGTFMRVEEREIPVRDIVRLTKES